jgi:hypothetical protein
MSPDSVHPLPRRPDTIDTTTPRGVTMTRASSTARGMPRSVLAFVGSLAVVAVAALVVSTVQLVEA